MLNDPIVKELLMEITDNDENSFPIIKCIMDGTTIDLEISEQTEIKLTIVRKILYKLYDAGIANCKKAKDRKTNWDMYVWKLEEINIVEAVTEKYKTLSADIEKSIEYEDENMFFACKTNGHRYKFETASEFNFLCPKCEEPLEFEDNTSVIAALMKENDKCKVKGKL